MRSKARRHAVGTPEDPAARETAVSPPLTGGQRGGQRVGTREGAAVREAARLPSRPRRPLDAVDLLKEAVRSRRDYLLRIWDWTEEEFLKYAPEKRFCDFIDGELIVHSPVRPIHQDIVGRLFFLLMAHTSARGLGKVLSGPLPRASALARSWSPTSSSSARIASVSSRSSTWTALPTSASRSSPLPPGGTTWPRRQPSTWRAPWASAGSWMAGITESWYTVHSHRVSTAWRYVPAALRPWLFPGSG